MVVLLQAVRFVLVLATLAVALLVILELSGRVMRDDFELAHAIAHYATNPTEATRQEVDDATAAAGGRFIIEQTVLALVFICLCGGVFIATRAIRARTI
jgi:predicted PurR-regulated permease PerM